MDQSNANPTVLKWVICSWLQFIKTKWHDALLDDKRVNSNALKSVYYFIISFLEQLKVKPSGTDRVKWSYTLDMFLFNF